MLTLETCTKVKTPDLFGPRKEAFLVLVARLFHSGFSRVLQALLVPLDKKKSPHPNGDGLFSFGLMERGRTVRPAAGEVCAYSALLIFMQQNPPDLSKSLNRRVFLRAWDARAAGHQADTQGQQERPPPWRVERYIHGFFTVPKP